jgi:outer membrane protein assembly factor BamB
MTDRMRRPIRSTRALGALLALTASTVACSSSPRAERGESTSTVSSSAAPTTTVPGPVADQTPPLGTFGLAYHDDQLWVADFYRGQVLAVDPDSGSIVKRLESQDGVSEEVNDVSVRDDGTIFWLGYNDGAVAVLAGNEYKTFGDVTPGTYSIALSADGKTLYAGGAVGHPSQLWTFDLTKQEQTKKSTTATAMRSFDVGPDGKLYAPRFGAATAKAGLSGALLQVDPVTGTPVELVSDLDGPIAVKLSRDGTTAHVLCLPPAGKPSVQSIDLTTRLRKGPAVELRTPLADNLAVADDGRIFVSSYNESVISIIGTDGQVKTLHIGQPAPAPA